MFPRHKLRYLLKSSILFSVSKALSEASTSGNSRLYTCGSVPVKRHSTSMSFLFDKSNTSPEKPMKGPLYPMSIPYFSFISPTNSLLEEAKHIFLSFEPIEHSQILFSLLRKFAKWSSQIQLIVSCKLVYFVSQKCSKAI